MTIPLHIILFRVSENKTVINEDLKVMNIKSGLFIKSSTCSLTYHLFKNRFYRNVFYKRIGKISKICSWLLPADKYFFPCEDIGGGIYPAHPFATILNAKKIGRNFVVRQCTTIGNKIDGAAADIPTIEDNVNLGANVTIIGRITIGSNVIIGAGSVITKDIPSNSVVVGNPFRIIKRNEDISI